MPQQTPFKIHSKGLTVAVRLTPGARVSAITGLADTVDGGVALKASVNVAPEDGKANKALIELLARAWDLPKGALSLLSGATNRQKVVLVEGDGGALFSQLSAWLERQAKSL
jgi:uncharacterized protein